MISEITAKLLNEQTTGQLYFATLVNDEMVDDLAWTMTIGGSADSFGTPKCK